MNRKMRVAGVVTYLDASGKRLSIPHGKCEVDETSDNEVIIHWQDQQSNKRQNTFSNAEYAQYQHNKALLPR